MRIAELDPATMTWTELGFTGKADFNAEEGWTLLPDGSFLTVDVLNTPNTERYMYTDAAGAGQWASLGPTPVSLTWNYGLPPVAYPGGIYDPPGETGPCMLRPNATVFCTGASDEDADPCRAHGHLRYPVESMDRRPRLSCRAKMPATRARRSCPNGNVLVSGDTGTLYEFDGTALTQTSHRKRRPR